jgi:hypothetical protein
MANTWLRSWLGAGNQPRKKRGRRPVGRRRLALERLEDRTVPVTTSYHFDFGPANSPVAPGWLGVSAATIYNRKSEFGWLAGYNMGGVNQYTGVAVKHSFVQAPDESFAVDLVNGTYNVILTMGDANSARGPFTVYLNGQQVDTISTAAGQFVTPTYQVNVTGGQLVVRLAGQGSALALINGLAINPVTFALTKTGIVPPPPPITASFGPTGTITEGGSGTVAFGGVKGGTGPYTFSFGFNSIGNFESTGGTQASLAIPPQYLAGPTVRVVRGKVTDRNGVTSEFTTLLTVKNAPPAVTAGAAGQTSGLGTAKTFNLGSFTDPGANDGPWTVTVAWGDGQSSTFAATVPGALSPSHTYHKMAAYTITVTVKDAYGASGSAKTSLVPSPSSPLSATFDNGGQVDEGNTGTVSFSNVSGGTGPYMYSYDFGNDGTFEIAGSTSPTATVPAQYLGPVSQIIHGRVTDSLGATADFTTTIAVNNLPPVLTAGPAQTTGTHSLTSFSIGSFTDPGVNDGPWTVVVGWGDGTSSMFVATQGALTASHTYTSAGAYTAVVTVSDKYGASSSGSVPLTVTSPRATFGNSGPVNEGSTGSVSFSNVIDGIGPFTYSYDFGNDGTFEIAGSASPTATVPAQFLSVGGDVVHGRVTDSTGAYADYTTTITVNNLAPVVTPGGGQITGVGLSTTIGLGSFTDPGANDGPWSVVVAWGDGTGSLFTATPGALSGTHTYASSGVYSVVVTVTDKYGASGSASTPLTASTSTLSAMLGNGGPVNEGSTGTVTFSNVGGGVGPYTYSFDFNNDGTFEVVGGTSASATVPALYLNPLSQVIHGRVTDSTGASADFTTTITVNNLAPVVAAGGAGQAASPGVATSFALGSFTDPGANDGLWTVKVNWGDGTNTTYSASVQGPLSQFHTYTSPGTYTAVVTVTDKFGASGSASTTASVGGPLSATFGNGGPADEGSTVTVSFSNVSGGTGTYSYSFDFGNNGTFEIVASSSPTAWVPAQYLNPANQVVHGRVTDSSGASADFTTSITVNNLPPVVIAGAGQTGLIGAAASFKLGSFTDPGVNDGPWTVAVNWGDGTSSTFTSIAQAGLAGTHTYSGAGTFTASVTVTDKYGASGSASTQVNVSSTLSSSANFRFADFSTRGAWRTVYGADGYDLAQGASSLPSYAQVGLSGQVAYTWAGSTNDLRALQLPGTSGGIAACWFSPSSFTIDVNLSDGQTHQVALYLLNWDGTNGDRVDVLDAATGQVLDSRAAGLFQGGEYMVWNLSGHVQLRVDNNGGHNGVASGLFFDGASATPAPAASYIVTQNDVIPDFGAHPSVTAVQSGNWSNPATWSTGQVPGAGDVVAIGANMAVTYDVVSTAVVKTVEIRSGGTLQFRTDINTQLTVANLLVLAGGTLQVGTAANPVQSTVKALIVFPDQPLDLVNDPFQYGNGLIALGKVTMYGAVKSATFVTLAAEAHAGDTTLTLSQPVSGWQPGDRLILPDSRQLYTEVTGTSFVGQWETVTITGVSADGLTITLSQPLLYTHLGARDGNGTLTFLPDVGDLTRNVVVRSANAAGTRGHVTFLDRADVDIRYTQFSGLGRTQIGALDNTYYDGVANAYHVGTNQDGRYPVQFDYLLGPTQTPADGYQYTFVGNSVFCPLDPMPFRWGIALHGSSYGLIQDNVVYNWAGGGIVADTGAESYNVIDHNFVVRVLSSANTVNAAWQRADQGGASGLASEGVGLWFRGFTNYVRNNVAADATSYGYTYFANSLETVQIPLAQGDDPSVPGQALAVNQNDTPILQFQGNEAYGAMPAGLTIWWLGTTGDNWYADAATSVVKDFHVWNTHEDAYFGYESNRLTIDGLVALGDASLLQHGYGAVAVTSGDYLSKDLLITNSDIEGMLAGFEPSMDTGGGTQTIQNSYLRNYRNIVLAPLSGTTSTSLTIAARKTVVSNVTFAAPNMAVSSYLGPMYDIDMISYDPSLGVGAFNLVQLDQLLVYNYNGVAGNNFQVYYGNQSAAYVLPKSTYNADGTISMNASPVAGLTNQQAWATYQIAYAGAIAPTTTTFATINGLIRAF